VTQGQDDDSDPGYGLLVIDPDAAPRRVLEAQLARHLTDGNASGDTPTAEPVAVDGRASLEEALRAWPAGHPAPWAVVILAASSEAAARIATHALLSRGRPAPRCIVLLPPGAASSPQEWPAGIIRLDRPARLPALLDAVRAALTGAESLKNDGGHTQASMGAFPLGPFLCDPGQRILTNRDNGRATALTEKEAAILACLRAARQTVARSALLSRVWGYRGGVSTHTLETHIHRLRRKIEADPRRPTLLITDGGGYRLVG